jgi:hypothetical protein
MTDMSEYHAVWDCYDCGTDLTVTYEVRGGACDGRDTPYPLYARVLEVDAPCGHEQGAERMECVAQADMECRLTAQREAGNE